MSFSICETYCTLSASIMEQNNVINTMFTPKKALSYMRVSTRGQAERGGGADEGFSIPAQRAANKQKASALGALEFVDRGASAKSADREDLQNMLAYIQENDVDYVIVHKADRLARNREDDIEIMRVLRERGVKLVSTSEAIDDSPSGMLLHGIMSSIAEFYSRNLASEVVKGMDQKVKGGGTVSKAPLGYKNVRTIDDKGREERTVVLDDERAPLMRLAFEMYATGEWVVNDLAEYLAARGLTTKPTPRVPSKPINKRLLNKLLVNPYYKGLVRFNGKYYPGSHEPLVDEETWQTVQNILSSHINGERTRKHPHFLKSTIYCGTCGSRLLVQYARSSSGLYYPYFSCAGRHNKTCKCHQKSLLIEDVERQIEAFYGSISIKPEVRHELEAWITAEIDKSAEKFESERHDLELEKDKIERKQKKLLETYYADAIPIELFKAEQEELKTAIAAIEKRLAAHDTHYGDTKLKLGKCLEIIEDCGMAYRLAPNDIKRGYNQAIFERLLIGGDGTVTPEYKEPFSAIFDVLSKAETARTEENSPVSANRTVSLADFFREMRNTASHFLGRCFSNNVLVDDTRLELVTSRTSSGCATSCANRPCY